jgi:hypothetical protein
MASGSSLSYVMTFCGKCNCGCPELFVDREAPAAQQIVLTDDFGDRVRMSVEQLESIIEEASSGRLTQLVANELAVSTR